ncbi:MAG: flavodoxin family protein [Muribaculaceae bacterium]|nr:flavodoxin family protein [Muribaculaceae bacterium]
MKVIGINASPRKGWNDDILMRKALEGAVSEGAEAEVINLYGLNYKGCYSCFACKRKGNTCNGLCAIKDDLRPVLEKILAADVLIVASPNYFGYPTGMLRSMVERLLYPSTSYQVENGRPKGSLMKKILPTGIIFTMNSTPELYGAMNYESTLGATTSNFQYVFGYAEQYNCFATKQFKDYSQMEADVFDAVEIEKRHETVFPVDEKNCYELGRRLIRKAVELNK